MCETPRVLVYGQPFNDLSGGGITLTNLFKGWPKDKLAATFVVWNDIVVNTTVCTNYYLIGKSEHKWRFPLNLIKKPFPSSGIIQTKEEEQAATGLRKVTVRHYLSDLINPILHWLGIYHMASRIALSELQRTWIKDFKPDVLYLQVSSLEGMAFANKLIDYCSIPTVMHMMDDWPSTLGRNGLFSMYWKDKANKEFLKLLSRTDKCLTISDAMAIEYEKRYGRLFDAFNNPVEIDHNKLLNIDRFEIDQPFFRVLYVGRIGTANKHSIVSFAKAISNINIHGREVHFAIFSKDVNDSILDPIRNLRHVFLNQAIPYTQVPNLISKYDLLLLPLDFTEDAIRFAKFSIPTKATEYMVSGVPILVFAPEETAVSRFFRDHDCGFCLTHKSYHDIVNSIIYLITNTDFRMRVSHNAVKVVTEKFDAEKVRVKFKSILSNISKRE